MKKRFITYLLCGLLAFLFSFFNVFGSLEQGFEDICFHKPEVTHDNIKIIKIDDKTMERLGDYSDWDRSVYTKLLETICVSEDIQPAVVGFDILFNAQKDTEIDSKFALVCENYGNAVCAFSYVFDKDLVVDAHGNVQESSLIVEEVVMPYKGLKDATTQGFANGLLDVSDGVVRSALLYYDEDNGKRQDNFSVAVSKKYMEVRGEEFVYPTDEAVMKFRYSGGVGEYEAVSLCDVLDGKIPAEAFDDCIVLVGAYAQGMMDSYYVPVDRGQQMYGVEIHANIIQALIEEKIIRETPAWLDGFVAAIVVILLMGICEKLSAVKTVVLCSVTVGGKIIADWLVFGAGYSIEHLTIPVMSLCVAVYFVVVHYYRARAAKLQVEKAFSKYVAPQVIKEIAGNGSYEIKLGGENRDIAALFVDIRGFTTLSESLEPEKVVAILNKYLAMTTECIFRNGGTLDKYIGDATMAVFNAPFELEDYVFKAVLTAWDIVQAGKEIEKDVLEQYGKKIGFGVGVNCGPAIVGNIGCDFRMDYTAIGDTVNTAARLESNAPAAEVYISDGVYNRVKERIAVNEVGEIPLKGKSNNVFVYSVTDIKKS